MDYAKTLTSMIESDRGITRTLDQTYYGDDESGIKPNKNFVAEMNKNPELWKMAKTIENLITGYSVHAGGVIFVDEPFENTCSLMKSPEGDTVICYELHDAESTGLIKYDILSIKALDKIRTCIELLLKDNKIEDKGSLKDTYENVIGIYNLERDDPKMWELVQKHKITSLFQFEEQSGIQGIELVKPTSVDDLAVLNSVIRLMPQEKGAERPLEKFARFKADINNWYEEMNEYQLNPQEQKILKKVLSVSFGICESQESFMTLVQIPECGGYSLNWSDKLRKSIAKKKPEEFIQLQEEYYKNIEDKGLSYNLCNYVWKVLVCTSRG